MAKGFKTGGRDIKPGEVRNPYGQGGKQQMDLSKARKQNQTKVALVMSKYMSLSMAELKKLSKDDSLSSFDSIVIEILLRAKQGGDYQRLNFILERLVGKVKNEVDVTSSDDSLTKKETIIVIPDNNRKG